LALTVAVAVVIRSSLPRPLPFLQTAFLLEGWAARGMELNVPIWSLGTEWVGYLAFPLVALACLRLRSARSLATAIVLVLLVELVAFAAIPGTPFGAEGPGPRLLRMAGGFSAGCLLWRLHHVAEVRSAQSDWLLVTAVLGAAVTLRVSPFAGLVMPFFVLLVHAAAVPGRLTSFLLERPIVLFLGRISFSLYLSHFLVMLLGVHYQGAGASAVRRAAISAMVYVAALVLAFILCTTAEEPFRRWGAGRREPAAP
jgi:peptidoglycan/LPS O-acetylase OafA/YrhL